MPHLGWLFIDYMKALFQISDDQVYSYSYSYTDDEAGVDPAGRSFYRGEAPTFMKRVLKAGKGKQAIRSVLENPSVNLLGCTYFFFHEGSGKRETPKLSS